MPVLREEDCRFPMVEKSPLLVVITGAPATGKSTVGRYLSEWHRLPLFSKDALKEVLFDALGWSDRAWSKRLSVASLDVMFHLMAMELSVRRSLIVESNFDCELDTERFLALKQRYPFNPIQVLCHADPDALAMRYARRAQIPQRHPGHVDHLLAKELDPIVQLRKHAPLGIGGLMIEVDTTHAEAVDYTSISQAIASTERGSL